MDLELLRHLEGVSEILDLVAQHLVLRLSLLLVLVGRDRLDARGASARGVCLGLVQPPLRVRDRVVNVAVGHAVRERDLMGRPAVHPRGPLRPRPPRGLGRGRERRRPGPRRRGSRGLRPGGRLGGGALPPSALQAELRAGGLAAGADVQERAVHGELQQRGVPGPVAGEGPVLKRGGVDVEVDKLVHDLRGGPLPAGDHHGCELCAVELAPRLQG
mmetsp:Transcript_108728/g.318101  ORF Transcript_108728/g.318101 Transcript_108728/m.318101 type:complete len:216 (+) Transcript_108728:537-1184(+)